MVTVFPNLEHFATHIQQVTFQYKVYFQCAETKVILRSLEAVKPENPEAAGAWGAAQSPGLPTAPSTLRPAANSGTAQTERQPRARQEPAPAPEAGGARHYLEVRGLPLHPGHAGTRNVPVRSQSRVEETNRSQGEPASPHLRAAPQRPQRRDTRRPPAEPAVGASAPRAPRAQHRGPPRSPTRAPPRPPAPAARPRAAGAGGHPPGAGSRRRGRPGRLGASRRRESPVTRAAFRASASPASRGSGGSPGGRLPPAGCGGRGLGGATPTADPAPPRGPGRDGAAATWDRGAWDVRRAGRGGSGLLPCESSGSQGSQPGPRPSRGPSPRGARAAPTASGGVVRPRLLLARRPRGLPRRQISQENNFCHGVPENFRNTGSTPPQAPRAREGAEPAGRRLGACAVG
nr:collagen alpha-1(III) chain-like [Oryctolagus cuniculus]